MHAEDADDEEYVDWSSGPRIAALREAEEAARWQTPRLGIDFGNVILADDGGRFKESRGLMQCKAVEGAREGVRALVKLFGPEHVFIVSKAGRRLTKLTLEWLHAGFLKDTGLLGDDGHIFFVPRRMEKRPVVEALAITHFIDDRMSVLRSLTKCQQRLLMCGPWVQHDDRHDRHDRKDKVKKVVVHSWPEAVDAAKKWFDQRHRVESDRPTSPRRQGEMGLADRCSALEADLAHLHAHYDSLRQSLANMEAHARQVDGLLTCREEENLRLRAELRARAEAQIPPTPARSKPPCAPPSYPAPTARTLPCAAR